MRILVLNQDWFVEEFRAAGHEVLTCGISRHLDVELPIPLLHLDTIIEEHWGGGKPDVILVHDNSAPIAVAGIEETDIPILFFAVDTHHHAELHTALTHVVDFTFVAQKDYIKEMEKEAGSPIEWLPLWASRHVEPSEDKQHGAVFVGTLRRDLNADRVDFFEALQKEVPLLCETGKFWEIFPRSEIVINQTVKGDLNFRVFESMMCGSMLLTEWSKNGLLDLFQDGEELVTYRKGDVADAAEKIRYYLDHQAECRAIAKRGREAIFRQHLVSHRAESVLAKLESLEKQPRSKRHFLAWMMNCSGLAKRLWKLDTGLAKSALVNAMKSANTAYELDEELNEYFSYPLTFCCFHYDRLFQSRAGFELLSHFANRFPVLALLQLALVRDALNRGQIEQARKLAGSLANGTHTESSIFQAAEEAVTSLLGDSFL